MNAAAILTADCSLADDENRDGIIQKHEYKSLYLRLVGAYADDGDDSTNLDLHEVDSSFEADWLQDSHGDETIDRQEFVDSVFQLADLWSVQRRQHPTPSCLLPHCPKEP